MGSQLESKEVALAKEKKKLPLGGSLFLVQFRSALLPSRNIDLWLFGFSYLPKCLLVCFIYY